MQGLLAFRTALVALCGQLGALCLSPLIFIILTNEKVPSTIQQFSGGEFRDFIRAESKMKKNENFTKEPRSRRIVKQEEGEPPPPPAPGCLALTSSSRSPKAQCRVQTLRHIACCLLPV